MKFILTLFFFCSLSFAGLSQDSANSEKNIDSVAQAKATVMNETVRMMQSFGATLQMNSAYTREEVEKKFKKKMDISDLPDSIKDDLKSDAMSQFEVEQVYRLNLEGEEWKKYEVVAFNTSDKRKAVLVYDSQGNLLY